MPGFALPKSHYTAVEDGFKRPKLTSLQHCTLEGEAARLKVQGLPGYTGRP